MNIRSIRHKGLKRRIEKDDDQGIRRATLSDFVHEKKSLSPEMALRIEKAFGVSMDTLLRMQAWRDAYTMRQRAEEIHVEPYRIV
jgi:antitoxin HigA-1